MKSPTDLYHYKAYVTRVPGSQVCLVDIDLGLGVWTRGQEIHLQRVSVAEKDELAARDHLRALILDREVLLRTIKDRRNKTQLLYGEITVVTEEGDTVDVIEALIEQGLATRTDG